MTGTHRENRGAEKRDVLPAPICYPFMLVTIVRFHLQGMGPEWNETTQTRESIQVELLSALGDPPLSLSLMRLSALGDTPPFPCPRRACGNLRWFLCDCGCGQRSEKYPHTCLFLCLQTFLLSHWGSCVCDGQSKLSMMDCVQAGKFKIYRTDTDEC